MSCFVYRSTKSLIEVAQEQPKSNGPLVKLHAKLVTVLWIIMGLDIKSVKPLALFDTTVIICPLNCLLIFFIYHNIVVCLTDILSDML